MNEYFDVLESNGAYENKIASREECHQKGLWHKAIALIIISEDNKKVLLQQRSANKKLWPNLWDFSAGGHVLAGELGYQAAIRETKEELGIEVEKSSLEFIGATISEDIKNDIINRHFNEFYVVHKNIDIKDITLQKDEVQDIKWIDINQLINRIKNNYQDLTLKKDFWNYIIKYFEIIETQKYWH